VPSAEVPGREELTVVYATAPEGNIIELQVRQRQENRPPRVDGF
jgi:hypothetical protein